VHPRGKTPQKKKNTTNQKTGKYPFATSQTWLLEGEEEASCAPEDAVLSKSFDKPGRSVTCSKGTVICRLLVRERSAGRGALHHVTGGEVAHQEEKKKPSRPTQRTRIEERRGTEHSQACRKRGGKEIVRGGGGISSTVPPWEPWKRGLGVPFFL